MLSNTRLATRLLISFLFVAAIALAMAVLGFVSIQNLGDNLDEMGRKRVPSIIDVSSAVAGFLRVNQVERTLMAPSLNTTQRQQIYSAGETALKELEEAVEDLKKQLQTREELEKLASFQKVYETWKTQYHKRIIELAQRRDERASAGAAAEEVARLNQELIALNMESRDTSNAVYRELREGLEKTLRQETDDSVKAALENATTQRVVMATAAVIGISLALLLAILLSRSISRALERAISELTESSEQIRSASGELSAASQELSEAASEQAGAIEETSASLHEMTSMMESSVENETQASTMLDAMNRTAEDSNTTMTELIGSMNSILESNEKIRQLVNVISAIGEQTEVIDEIVFQTKLLSFNASVEAERAGEHGRGFAVVAQEVGNLAEMSSKAAAQISSIVKESIRNADQITGENKRKVEQGHGLVVSMAQVLKNLAEKSSTVANMARQNTHTAKEQLNAISQINTAMSQLDQATQQNAGIAEESAAASEELSAQAEVLTDNIDRLRKLVDGAVGEGGGHAPRKAPAPAISTRKAPGVRAKPARVAKEKAAAPLPTLQVASSEPARERGKAVNDSDEQWERL